jgi:hypothetical protein|tara:strand:+ start:131 stop:646 length:516 start_codon:yes stop_codon:yes gene_type:complete
MKTFWKEENYNLETDGAVKNVNGSFIFIPYLKGVNDLIYKSYIKELLKFDWKHYKLYLVGGILEGWKTTDIDICVIGKRTKELSDLLNKSRELGPLDMFWVKSLKDVKGNGSRIWKFAKSHDRWSNTQSQWNGKWKKDGLFHMSKKFPIKEGREYKKEPLLLNRKNSLSLL